MRYILKDPSYNARKEYQDKPRRNDRGSLVEQVEIAENLGVISSKSKPEHEIVFDDKIYNPDIEPLFDDLKIEESNLDT